MNPTLKRGLRRLLPRALKPHTIYAGPLRNLRIVTSWHDYPAAILGRTERPLLDWFAQNVRRGETWLDIGAHYGYTALALCKLVGAEGRVFAFEPMLTSAGCIAETRRLNHLTQLIVVPLALGNSPGFAVEHLPVVRGMVDSTLRAPAGCNGLSNGHWHETLFVTQLDQLWQGLAGNDPRVQGIKLDVQAMELDVLHGMQNLLRQQHPKLVIEVHAGVSRPELLLLLASIGYTNAAMPIEPAPGETTAQFFDDKSYVFLGDETSEGRDVPNE